VDVNTGKFVGSGGNLEQTVTRNNIEAAEEIVRQLRLRDIGGIIVIDFIDMVLESNRDLVLRRLTECLGRDRTKHQVAEVTSLGLVQMTRKRVGQGLLEVFSEPCEHCRGRGVLVHIDPVDERRRGGAGQNSGGNGRREHGRPERPGGQPKETPAAEPEEVSLEAAPQGDEDGAVGDVVRTGGGRRNRGRRNRGQSGEDRAAEDAAVLTAVRTGEEPDVEPDVEELAASHEPATAEPVTAEPVTAEPVTEAPVTEAPVTVAPVDEPSVAEPTEQPEPAVEVPGGTAAGTVEEPTPAQEPVAVGTGDGETADVSRPRRRRAASRPAGPPA
jgi:ribonuclease E